MTDTQEYELLASRIDDFISERLDHGSFPPSVSGTELIYQALGLAFPGEADAFATLADRLAEHCIRVVEDPYTGADLLVGVKLKPEYIPASALTSEAFHLPLAHR